MIKYNLGLIKIKQNVKTSTLRRIHKETRVKAESK